ncbi:discoidin domain-containing protein [Paenibacillus sp. OVF10]|nr:discoidin domain-containing protein [Paenibacillus sp. OVF10]
MAVLGDQLNNPESGWRRYDDTHAGLNYTGSWYKVTGDKYFNGSVNVTTRAADNNYVSFSFYGTKVRIISDIAQDRHSNNTITVDGVTESFNTYKSGTAVFNAIVYEKTNLPFGFHTVRITVGSNRINFIMDAIDIDESGHLYGYALATPESGWQRYDDTNDMIVYTGTWSTETLAGNYNGSAKYTSTSGSTMSFTFYGTKIRIIGGLYSGRTTTAQVVIDGINVGIINEDSTTSRTKALVFEKNDLSQGKHVVQIKTVDNKTLILDAVDVGEDGYMARSIGASLTSPDTGWKRYDDSSSEIKYDGWLRYPTGQAGSYNNSFSASNNTVNKKATFTFKGTKLRLITMTHSDSTTIGKISIDGTPYDASFYSSSAINQVLVFEKTGLEDSLHTIEIYSPEAKNIRIDAVDIDLDGRMFHPDEVTDPIDLTIGKRIRCYYSTNNGVVGNFAFFGQETAPFITTSAGAGGDLYFICVDKDRAGQLKLIADRNIQHSISWDTINASGVASGSGVPLPKKGYYVSMIPAMTSNTTPQGVAAASTTYSASLEAWKAFDKNTADAGWLMESNKWNGAWISYTFPQPTVINKYGIKGPNSNASTDNAKSWRFEGSNDGTNWTVLDTKTNQPAWSTGEYREYVFTNKDTYKTCRLVFTANNGGAYVRTMAVDMFQLIEEDSVPSVDLSILRLPTGGINSSDKDNEWDMYIVNSTLNGTIIAGDDNVWNYNGGSSWTSTTNTAGSANRTGRGASGNVGASGYNPTSYVAAATATGFRPLMVIEILPMNRSFIHHDGTYKKYQTEALTWHTISATLPSEDTFINDGMNDLSVLDRKNEVFSQTMTANGSLGSGKMFKGSIDLKKYFEITNVNVK